MTATRYRDLTKQITSNLAPLRASAPQVMKSFAEMGKAAIADGALDAKTKELIALAIGVATRCDGCIGVHTDAAIKEAHRAVQEVLEHALAEFRVLDLGVPLHAIETTLIVSKRSNRGGLGRSNNSETVGGGGNLVTVAHPTNLLHWLVAQKNSGGVEAQLGSAILALTGLIDSATKCLSQNLEAVANAQDRNSKLQNLRI